MTMTRRTALALPIAALAATGALAQGHVITGTATYRERIALRPGAVLEVTLLDISRADAPAERIAQARIDVAGQVPIPFSLAYDPARIQPNRTYSLQARLMFGDEVAFRSDTVTPVLTRGAGTHAEILLRRARPAASGGADAASPVGGLWIVEDIAGRGVVDRLQTTLTLDGQGRAYGSGGCNRFTGGYTLDGAALRFGAMASTNMACVPAAMDQEARFHRALAEVAGWRMDGGILHLTNAGGAPVLRLARGS